MGADHRGKTERSYTSHTSTFTHLLKHIMELLQGGSHSSVATHAACIAVEVNVGHAVQSVMTEGADHGGSHCPVVIVGLLINWRFIQVGIIGRVDVPPLVRIESLHQEC